MGHRRAWMMGVLASLVVVTACGGSDAPVASGTGNAAVSAPGTSSGGSATTKPAAGCSTALTVTTKEGTSTIDGKSAYADITGATGQSANFTLANYDIPVASARSVLQPSGLSAGQSVVIVHTSATDKIVAGDYIDQIKAPAGAAGKVDFFEIDTSAGRALPTAGHTVTITEVADDHVCGTLTPEPGNAATAGATASGTFRAKRIDTGPTTTAPRTTGTR